MEILINTDKQEYFKCSMYLMRKYFGLREIILLFILMVAAVLLYVFSNNILIFVLFGITCALLFFTFLLFLWTSISGYKVDVEKKKIAKIKLLFEDKALIATSLGKGGEPIFSETHNYEKLENVVIKRNFIYIYAGVAVFYYINKKDLSEEMWAELGQTLFDIVPPEKFRFRKRIRTFPKRTKIDKK